VAGIEDVPTNSVFAELFAASADLEELYFGPEDDVAPGSVQPVIRMNSKGERKISLMRWGFK
jgi:putative SOS response-associated peptidase YedK